MYLLTALFLPIVSYRFFFVIYLYHSLILGSVSGGRDEGLGAFLIRFLIQVLMNFTIGLIGAAVGFMWTLWSVIQSFQPGVCRVCPYIYFGFILKIRKKDDIKMQTQIYIFPLLVGDIPMATYGLSDPPSDDYIN